MNLYVGNLSYAVTEEELRQHFAQHGQVTSVAIIKDRFTGDPRGFAFVEMANAPEAQAAIAALNGKDFKGRALTVNEARPRTEGGREGGFGGGNRGGGFGGNRGGGDRGGFGGGNRGGGYGGNRGGGDRNSGGNRGW